jgi:hypothetical protein
MPDPKAEALKTIVKAHFDQADPELKTSFQDIEPQLSKLIQEFLGEDNRATDQLLNTIYVLANVDETDKESTQQIKDLLLKRLDEDI